MTDITIPREVLAAVDEVIFYEGGSVEAACIAMLKAWPGMSDIPAGEFDGEQYPRIIHLPLPAENGNDK